MDIATFNARYPEFVDSNKVMTALSDADILLSTFCIDESKLFLAHGYLAAHLLSISNGAAELALKRVKAGPVELEFSDKALGAKYDWLMQSSYGETLQLLVNDPPPTYDGIGMVVV